MKICKKCDISKSLIKFKVCKACVGGRRNICRKCDKSTSPEEAKKYKLRHSYGLSLMEYQQLLLNQNGKCTICKGITDKALAVDHDHFTGKVRGLLCSSCNIGLGNFKDSEQSLYAAVAYLQQNK